MNNTIELPTDYQNFIALSRYARWLPEEGRRETWKFFEGGNVVSKPSKTPYNKK